MDIADTGISRARALPFKIGFWLSVVAAPVNAFVYLWILIAPVLVLAGLVVGFWKTPFVHRNDVYFSALVLALVSGKLPSAFSLLEPISSGVLSSFVDSFAVFMAAVATALVLRSAFSSHKQAGSNEGEC